MLLAVILGLRCPCSLKFVLIKSNTKVKAFTVQHGKVAILRDVNRSDRGQHQLSVVGVEYSLIAVVAGPYHDDDIVVETERALLNRAMLLLGSVRHWGSMNVSRNQ